MLPTYRHYILFSLDDLGYACTKLATLFNLCKSCGTISFSLQPPTNGNFVILRVPNLLAFGSASCKRNWGSLFVYLNTNLFCVCKVRATDLFLVLVAPLTSTTNVELIEKRNHIILCTRVTLKIRFYGRGCGSLFFHTLLANRLYLIVNDKSMKVPAFHDRHPCCSFEMRFLAYFTEVF